MEGTPWGIPIEPKRSKISVTTKNREDLRKAAIERISSMGVTSNWINESLIKSVENGILRAAMVG